MIRNERLKLLANALDRASTACVTVGILTPLAGLIYGVIPHASGAALAAACGVWLFVAVSLHYLARRVLGRLQE